MWDGESTAAVLKNGGTFSIVAAGLNWSCLRCKLFASSACVNQANVQTTSKWDLDGNKKLFDCCLASSELIAETEAFPSLLWQSLCIISLPQVGVLQAMRHHCPVTISKV